MWAYLLTDRLQTPHPTLPATVNCTHVHTSQLDLVLFCGMSNRCSIHLSYGGGRFSCTSVTNEQRMAQALENQAKLMLVTA